MIIFIGIINNNIWWNKFINQYDIKKIIAYSTCSQIGYMFMTNGINNSNLGIFHLITHGCFKALLFLSAGLIIHLCMNEQDLRKFGSFVFKFPITYLYFFIGTFSIISFPFSLVFILKILLSNLVSYPIMIYIYLYFYY